MRTHRRPEAGFTLIELMAVVAMVGILAMLATYSVKKYIASSKTSEAIQMIGSIKAAEETYKDETFSYLDVSTGLSKSNAYPPNFSPGRQKAAWGGAGPGLTGWQQLGVNPSGPVLFAYACTAGPAAIGVASPSSDSGNITITNWPATVTTPWYVVKAYADLAGNGTASSYAVFVSSSFANEIYSANN